MENAIHISFYIYAKICRVRLLRRLFYTSFKTSFTTALSHDVHAAMHLIVSLLCTSKDPDWTMTIIRLLESIPDSMLDNDKIISTYFNDVPGESTRMKLSMVRMVLCRCFSVEELKCLKMENEYPYEAKEMSPDVRDKHQRCELNMTDLLDEHEAILTKWMIRHGKINVREKTDKERFISEVRNAAEKSEPEAQLILALSYSDGFGVDQNLALTLEWLRKAANLNYHLAQCVLGYMYYLGYNVSENKEEGIKWLEIARNNGSEKAKIALKKIAGPGGKF